MAMTYHERFVNCLTGQRVDRPPYCMIWGPWATTWPRWHSEGCPFKDWAEIRAHFNADVPSHGVPVLYGPAPHRGYQRVLEETDEHVIYLDGWDIKRRNLKTSNSISEFIQFPVSDRESWEQFKAERLQIDHPDRFKGDWLATCKEWMNLGWPIQMGHYPDVTLFGGVRWMLGDEECLLSFYTQPDVVKDMMNHLTDLYLYVFERVVAEGVRVDMIHIWEDMSGRQGSLISPAHFREFMTPNYRRIKVFADKCNIPLMSMDTDGNPDTIVPPMMEGGINYIWPMEVAAGTDVNDYRRRYPELALMGGIDKRVLARDKQAIDTEIARIAPAIATGRYLPDLDHLVPDDVPWENYVYYVESMKKLVGIP